MSDLREAIEAIPENLPLGRPRYVSDYRREVLRVVEAYLQEHDARPKLGLATTHELITELMARADVAKTVGETWPLYSTVGGQLDRKPIALGGSDE